MLAILTPFNLIILIYLSMIFAIAIKASFSVSKVSDFVLANRSLSGHVTALGAGAADMSGWLLMSLPGLIFTFGMNQIWLPISLCIGAYINWKFIATRLRVYTELLDNSLTIPSSFNNRFPSNTDTLRIVTSIVVIIFFTYYAHAGFFMCAKVSEQLFSLTYHNALLISAIVMLTYTCLGGFLSVNWVDFFQGILMFVCLCVVPIFVTSKLGGLSTTHAELNNIHEYLNIFSEVEFIEILSLMGWGWDTLVRCIYYLDLWASAPIGKYLLLGKYVCHGWPYH